MRAQRPSRTRSGGSTLWHPPSRRRRGEAAAQAEQRADEEQQADSHHDDQFLPDDLESCAETIDALGVVARRGDRSRFDSRGSALADDVVHDVTVVVGPYVAAAASNIRLVLDNGRAACSTFARRSGR